MPQLLRFSGAASGVATEAGVDSWAGAGVAPAARLVLGLVVHPAPHPELTSRCRAAPGVARMRELSLVLQWGWRGAH